MKIFTLHHERIETGAKCELLKLAGAGVEIPAVLIGEEGRGRKRGVLPVDGAIAPWVIDGDNRRLGRIDRASIGTTKAGKPKLVAPRDGEDDRCLVVLLTDPGFRGGCDHTGERSDVPCPHRGKPGNRHYAKCQTCGVFCPDGVNYMDGDWMHPDEGMQRVFAPFPGEVVARGYTAQGAAGAMGGGEQIVAVVKEGDVFRATRSGRLYGAPSSHYYVYRGGELLTATWEERTVSDVF